MYRRVKIKPLFISICFLIVMHFSIYYPQHLCISEMVVRVAKKRFRKLLQDSKSRVAATVKTYALHIQSCCYVCSSILSLCLHCVAPIQLTSEAVAHFLNCFLSVSPFPEGTQEEVHVITMFI